MGGRPLVAGTSFHVHHQIPKIAIAFIVGMFGALAGALIYSNSQQRVVVSPPVAKAVPQRGSGTPIQDRSLSTTTPARATDSAAPNTTASDQGLSSTSTTTVPEDVSPPILTTTLPKRELSVSPIRIPTPTPQATRRVEPARASAPAPVYEAQSVPPPTREAQSVPQPIHLVPEPTHELYQATAAPTHSSVPVTPPVARTRMVEPGTPVFIRIAEPLSSGRNRAGDTFKAILDTPLVVDGTVVAPKDSMVLGVVVSARRSALLHTRSNLRLSLTNLTTADGKMINIETDLVEQESAHPNLIGEAKMATGAAVGAVFGAVKGAAEGIGLDSSYNDHAESAASKRNVFLPAGTRLRFRLSAPVEIR